MVNEKNKKHACPCCGYFTFKYELGNTFQICPVCYWEDDGVQLDDPTYEGGANRVSLYQAKKNYETFGAIESRFIEYVRLPLDEEQ